MLRTLALMGMMGIALAGCAVSAGEETDEATDNVAEASTANLLKNHGFEQKLSHEAEPGNWYSYSSAEDDVHRSKAAALGGDHGLVVSSHQYACAVQLVPAMGDAWYHLHGKARHVSGKPEQSLGMMFMHWDTQKNGWDVLTSAVRPAGAWDQWHSVDLDVSAPDGTDYVAVLIGQCDGESKSKYAWDGMSLERSPQ